MDGELIGDERLPEIVKPDPEALPRKETFHVTTADEFLAAIGPNREIILDGETLDLSKASGYGDVTSPYFYW